MRWEIIKKSEIESWNTKLKHTNAPYYQYPYYISGGYGSFFSNTLYIKYVADNRDLAYAAIIEIGMFPFKIGVVDGAPVLLETNFNYEEMLEKLKKFARQKHYVHLQLRPPSELEELLKNDQAFEKKVFFPFHQKEEYELNIYNQPEPELLASFKMQGRRKIVLAARVPYKFVKLENESQLKDVDKLFQQVTKTKGYQYTPFNVFERIYNYGKKHSLCDIYAAYLDDDMVNAVVIVKDGYSCYHMTSAMVVKGYKESESPPAKLHFFIMQDCFYNENKKYYNISYGGSDNLIRFKELFNPVTVKKPAYYTYIINKKALSFLENFSREKTARVRSFLRKISKYVSRCIIFFFLYSLLLIQKFLNEISNRNLSMMQALQE